jgi:putative oxidoreductase
MHEPTSSNRDFALLGLRIALGVLFIQAGWGKVAHIAGVVALGQRLHLPLPAVFGPGLAIVEFGGGFLIIGGLLTRPIALLLALDMLGALFLVKIHTPAFIGAEWLAFWIGLALLAFGAGSFSLDAFLQNRRAQGTLQSKVYPPMTAPQLRGGQDRAIRAEGETIGRPPQAKSSGVRR